MQVVLDPDKNFFVLQVDNFSSVGKVFRRMLFTPKDMGDGVWIIRTLSRQKIRYDDEVKSLIRSELKYKVNALKFNAQVLMIDEKNDSKIRGLK
jgi:hypothetical protein